MGIELVPFSDNTDILVLNIFPVPIMASIYNLLMRVVSDFGPDGLPSIQFQSFRNSGVTFLSCAWAATWLSAGKT